MIENNRSIVSVNFNEEYLLNKFGVTGDILVINGNDIFKHKADILIIDTSEIEELYNGLNDAIIYQFEHKHINLYKKYDLYEFDRLNRKKFENYKKVFITSMDRFYEEYNYKNIYSNICFVNDNEILDLVINDNIKKISNIKNKNIAMLKKYVDEQTDYFGSKDIMKEFNVSNRWIKRYMKDMNNIYNNIGYSYSKRKWYKVYKG